MLGADRALRRPDRLVAGPVHRFLFHERLALLEELVQPRVSDYSDAAADAESSEELFGFGSHFGNGLWLVNHLPQ